MQLPVPKPIPITFDIAVVQRIVRETRLAQGLPERITDPAVLDRLAVLIQGASKAVDA